MAETIRIDVDTLDHHCRRLDNVREDVALARDAAASVNLSNGAFGLMCAFMTLPLGIVQGLAKSALDSVDEMLVRNIEAVSDLSQGFKEAEQMAQDIIGSLESRLGSIQ